MPQHKGLPFYGAWIPDLLFLTLTLELSRTHCTTQVKTILRIKSSCNSNPGAFIKCQSHLSSSPLFKRVFSTTIGERCKSVTRILANFQPWIERENEKEKNERDCQRREISRWEMKRWGVERTSTYICKSIEDGILHCLSSERAT